MRIFIITILICRFSVFFLYSQNNVNDDYKPVFGFKESSKDIIIKNKLFAGHNYDVKYHRFNLFIDPDTLYIKAAVTTYFVCVSNADSLSFELSSALNVDSVIHKGQKLIFSHNSSDILNVYPLISLPAGSFDSITIFYKGSPSAGSGFGSFIKAAHDGVPVIWTLSEPYGAKDWWPCKNDLSDKADSIDVIVESPFPYRTASNGMLVNETISQGIVTAHWKHRYPIAAYLIAVAVTNYVEYSDYVVAGNDSLQILNYVFPEYLTTAQSKSPGLIPVMQLFDSLFIPYPFYEERYGHAQFMWGGGMEHQTMTFISDFEFGLMAHELAHSWFGNYITCGSWKDIWLNEGFATYLTGLSYEHLFNGYWWPVWKKMTIQHVLSEPDGSVFCYDTSNVSRVFNGRLSYNKGSLVLHQLRWVIGDSAFYAGMKNYLNDSSLAYAYAYSQDFISHMEAAADTSLTEFFNDWLYGEGYPVFQIHCDILSGTQVHLFISQITSHNSVDLFEMPLPLRFKNSFHDTLIVLNNTTNLQDWVIDLGFIPDSVIFDPDMWLLAKVNSITIGINSYNVVGDNLLIMPNPVSDYLNIRHSGQNILSVSALNSLGREVFLSDSIIPANELHTIDLNVLQTGFWLLKIRTEKQVLFRKIVKK